MSDQWIAVTEKLPEDKQVIDVKGIPYGQKRKVPKPLILSGLHYSKTAGLISVITHWKPHES